MKIARRAIVAALILAAPALAGGPIPQRLWVSDADWQQRRAAVLASPPLAGLVDVARDALARASVGGLDDDFADKRRNRIARLQPLTVLASLADEPAAAAEALPIVEALLADKRGSDLGRANVAQHAAIAFAFCRDQWTEEAVDRVAKALRTYADSLREINKGNPDSPFNNWWAVTHSGAGLAYLAAASVTPEARDDALLEAEKVASYLTNYGENGAYYEGGGYAMYAFSYWGPFLLACEESLGIDLARYAPGARRLGRSIHSLSTPAGPHSPRPRRLFWNDDGGGLASPDTMAMLAAVAPASERAWVEAANQRLFGLGPPAQLPERHGHAIWSALYAPLERVGSYDQGAPLTLLDTRLGLATFRNRYRDSEDSVFAVYAKAFHGGGHNQEDAGSFRFQSLGVGWAHAGGQAKPEPWHQNVPVRNGGRSQVVRGATGKVSYYAPRDDGGSVTVDLTDVYGVPRCRRHFAVRFDPLPGVEALVAVWDEIDEDSTSDWAWPLCYERHLKAEIRGAGRFTLAAPTGARLAVAIGGPETVTLTDREGEPSHRVFSEGTRFEYPPARYVNADLEGLDDGVLAVMAVCKGESPPVRFEGDGYDLRAIVGDRLVVRLDRSRWFNGPLRILPTKPDSETE